MIDENLAKQLIESTPKSVADSLNDVWGLILGDKIAFYRRRNAMKLSRLLHDEAERLGGRLDPSRIPDQFAFEWTEAATKKSNETIQKMFARILASAATDKGVADERLIYTLREMSGDDAILFTYLYSDADFRMTANRVLSDPIRIGMTELGIDVDLAYDSLLRIGLIRESMNVFDGNRRRSGWFYFDDDDSKQQQVDIQTHRLIKPSTIGLRLYHQVSDETVGEAGQ